MVLSLLPLSALAQGRIEGNLDKFGNPVGKQFSLAADGAFKGKRLLAWTNSYEVDSNIFRESNPLWAALRAKGFSVDLKSGPFQAEWLKSASQMWLFCDSSNTLADGDLAAIEAFVKQGKGLYIIADNDPYYVEGNQLCARLFNARLAGNYEGQQTIAVRGKGLTRQDYAKRGGGTSTKPPPGQGGGQPNVKLPGNVGRIESAEKSTHYVNDHALLTGIHYIYEGVTISHIEPNSTLTTVLVASDGQPLSAVPRDGKLKVVVDCGFTRYYVQYVSETAGTIRYAENIAAFLMGRGTSKPVDKQTIVELLASLETSQGAERKAPLAELGRRSPKYAEIKAELAEIRAKLSSDDQEVAAAARAQLANAFVRAPVSECLQWLGKEDGELSPLIWEQLDDRIARADDERKAGYRDTALAKVTDRAALLAERRAAIELLSKLKDRSAAGAVIDVLVELPRDLRPRAGLLLKELTGENFGPSAADGAAEVIVAAKKWKAWWKDNGEK
jgi:hypothetical protein